MEEIKGRANNKKITIVSVNIAVMVVYTLFARYNDPNELNILIGALFIAFHIILCLILAIFVWREELLLSALLVLLVGFSTCWIAFTH